MKPKQLIGVCFCMVIMGINSPVLADDFYAKREKSIRLGAITVTAQKQKENIYEIPVSIDCYKDIYFEGKKIDMLWGMVDYVPNLMNFDGGMTATVSQTQ